MAKKINLQYLLVSIIIFIISCNYKVVINTDPDDSTIFIDNVEIKSNAIFKTKNKEINVRVEREGFENYNSTFKNRFFILNHHNINLIKKKFNVSFATIDNRSKISIDNGEFTTLPLTIELEYGTHYIRLSQNGYADQEFETFVNGETKYKFRHQKNIISDKIKLIPLNIIDCGKQPKQVNFSFDDKYLFVSLLDDYGFDVINIKNLSLEQKIKVKNSEKKGYVEGLFIDKYKSFFISQMTTGNIYEFDISNIENIQYKRTIPTKGLWTKVIAYCEKKDLVATSNWCSNDISIIRYDNGEVIRKIENIIVPRGIIFSNDGEFLYATSFEGGQILKYNTTNWNLENKISDKGAPRQIVLNKTNTICYVTDMAYNSLYEIETKDFKLLNKIKVYNNPNTVDITPDDKYLFVSCRGPNNPNGYLERSLENGKIAIIDCEKKEVIGYIEGGAQPTGLDISNNGKLLAFSNFQDHNIEIYKIEYSH